MKSWRQVTPSRASSMAASQGPTCGYGARVAAQQQLAF